MNYNYTIIRLSQPQKSAYKPLKLILNNLEIHLFQKICVCSQINQRSKITKEKFRNFSGEIVISRYEILHT